MDKKLNKPISIVLGGYLFSLGFYFIWYLYFFVDKSFSVDCLLLFATVVFAITALYFFFYLLIWYINLFQKVWLSFSIVSIITLSIFFLIPSTNYAIYKLNLNQIINIKAIEKNEPERKFLSVNKTEFQKQAVNAKEKIQSEIERMEEIETKLKSEIAILQAKLESKSNENAELRKLLNDITRKMKSIEEQKTKRDIVTRTKSYKNLSKIKVNRVAGNTDLDTKNQEIVFKVQIISSSTRLSPNSQQFKGIKNVWEYEDNGLYKYTVGNQKDLKSASASQSEFRRKGFSGAFVVAFNNGKRVPVRKAKKLLTVYE